MGDMGLNMKLRVSTDASAAKGIASRRGLGKVRHVEVHQLWVQERVAQGDIEVRKVYRKTNPAESLTKHVGSEDTRVHMHHTCQEFREGRHHIAPQVAQ